MLTVNFSSRTPIFEQLYNDVIRLASIGVLKPNTKLPPVRTLATELGINPNTVQKAYKMLERDGYIYSTVGRGSFVSDKLAMSDAINDIAKKDFKEAVKTAYKKGLTKTVMKEIVDETMKEESND